MSKVFLSPFVFAPLTLLFQRFLKFFSTKKAHCNQCALAIAFSIIPLWGNGLFYQPFTAPRVMPLTK